VHWVELDGIRVPRRIGGHPALDLCNTWAGWGERPHPKREWLRDYDSLAVWSGYAELVEASDVRRLRRLGPRRPIEAAAVLADVRRLRTAVHTAVTEPEKERALRAVTGYARRAAAASSLRSSADGRARWELVGGIGLQMPLLAAAAAAADLLTSPDLPHVKACPGHDCGWLFVDRSGRRRWCSMTSCGNRAKVAAHARRQRAADG
jgi:predicted RNA-binding Zn ribbon-like protein